MAIRTRALALLLVSALVVPALTDAAEPGIDAVPVVSLRGPFGTVSGTDPDHPATAAPDERALDTWMRSATLELVLDPGLPPGGAVTITAEPTNGGDTLELPVEDGRWVVAPDVPGRYRVVATVELEGQPAGGSAWLIEVPDRPGDVETLMTMPALEASVSAASGAVAGVRGHGCLVDMCQEVGWRPPAASLEPLTVGVGEPLRLVLDDGSAIVHWEGRLEPQPGTDAETRLAQATFETPVAGPVLAGLEAEAPGEWLLELRADFDRARGWQWYLFRLVAE